MTFLTFVFFSCFYYHFLLLVLYYYVKLHISLYSCFIYLGYCSCSLLYISVNLRISPVCVFWRVACLGFNCNIFQLVDTNGRFQNFWITVKSVLLLDLSDGKRRFLEFYVDASLIFHMLKLTRFKPIRPAFYVKRWLLLWMVCTNFKFVFFPISEGSSCKNSYPILSREWRDSIKGCVVPMVPS